MRNCLPPKGKLPTATCAGVRWNALECARVRHNLGTNPWPLIDHLVRPVQERRRDRQAEGFDMQERMKSGPSGATAAVFLMEPTFPHHGGLLEPLHVFWEVGRERVGLDGSVRIEADC